jgi:hypothetical protein
MQQNPSSQEAQSVIVPPKIDDNPSIVDSALTKVRKYYDLGKTRSY